MEQEVEQLKVLVGDLFSKIEVGILHFEPAAS